MTRKKSNVKALALAVTCAILAGGYSGLSPVYAADVTVNGGTITVPAGDWNSAEEKSYTVSGASISASSIVGALTDQEIHSKTITANSAVFNGLAIGTEASGTYVAMTGGAITATGNITAGQFTVNGQSITADKIKGYDTAVTDVDALKTKIKKISYDDTLNTTKIDSNVSINGGVGATNYVKAGSFVQAGDGNGVFIRQEGIFIGADKDWEGQQKAAIKEDGSLKAASGKFNVDVDGKLFGADNSKKISVDQLITDSANVGGIKRTGSDTDGYTTTIEGKFTVKDDGSISTADGKFVVDENGNVLSKGSVTANEAGFNNLAVTDGVTVGDKDGAYVHLRNGNIIATGSVTANEAGFNNLAVTNGMTVGNGITYVNMLDGNVTATGDIKGKDITATGKISATGTAGRSSKHGDTTTIDGGIITTDTLKVERIELGETLVDENGTTISGSKLTINSDGSLSAASGAFKVDTDGRTTFVKDADNKTAINGGNIYAQAKSAASGAKSRFLHTGDGVRITGENGAGDVKTAYDFDTDTGKATIEKTTGGVTSSTTIEGSDVKLDDGQNNKTNITAGGATFTKDSGEHAGTTTIDGNTITTGTLNVTDIVLGGTMYDTAGKPLDGKLSIGSDGHLRAANGNFDVKDDGTLTNTVGNTTLKTDTDGASMSYDNGSVKSNVSVGDNNANVSTGNASIDVKDGSITDKVGTDTKNTTVKTTDENFSVKGKDGKGMDIDTTTGKTTFTGANYKEGATEAGTTTIDGNTITTGRLVTDELVITGKGDAEGDGTGTGSLAFGGNGTIKSDVKEDGSNKNTRFTTDIDAVSTTVTDGETTSTNEVKASGNTNIVKKDDTHKSEFKQDLTSIGGVVTNGEIKVAQTLDGTNGNITNEVTDTGGSSKLVQNGKGLEYTDSANTDNATRINSGDVSIGAAVEDNGSKGIDRINLSDLGQIDNIDGELQGREEFKNNSTAVGGLNAEAAIRREEVARLDNRIDDVNNRVNKVGAMAAAIASLKSIGYDPQAPSEFSIGLGQYKGETGIAMGFFHYPNKNFMVNVSLSTAGGETMGGIGATWRFGHKSPQKLLEEQRAAQAKKELAAAEKYQAAAQLAKEAQERAEYAAKLARQAQVSADNAKAAADATKAKHFQ